MSISENRTSALPDDPESPATDWVDECRAMDNSYGCTLPIGHGGDHIAHGSAGNVYHRWPPSPSPQVPAILEALVTKPNGKPEIDGNAFEVIIRMHTMEAQDVLNLGSVREFIGDALDSQDLQEEIDYTLEVHRVYKCK